MPKGMLEVRLLGSFDVKRDGKTITIPSRPAQSLFAYLILSSGTLHRREKLAGMLWPDSTEESARDYLRHGLWRIRKALGPADSKGKEAPYLIADDIHIGFNSDSPFTSDAAEIEKIDIARASTDELIRTLSIYQGELLPGFYEEWVVLEREHLRSIYEQKMDSLVNRLNSEGRWQDILTCAEKWISFGQRPESAYRALMSAHTALGDLSKMTAAYERCRKSLDEFGVEPSEHTHQLFRNLKTGKVIQQGSFGSIQKDGERWVPAPNNIPVPLTSFIGRDRDLKEIAKLLGATRLLTLTGPGGVGKTRLAIQTARISLKKFKDGVFWVDLVGLSDENLIPQEIAQVLQVPVVAAEPLIGTLKNYLRSKEILLVLDNCEHLIHTCAAVSEQLLGACAGLKILATSIEGLGLFNELIWQVPSLPLPLPGGAVSLEDLRKIASIELFQERAANAKSGFVLSEENATSVVQICERLDGIPLAIELAAARTKILSVHEIASRLDDRFSLLTSGNRTAIARHQTLRATIDWSHELLSEPERVLFRRLAVFAGGFTLETAETVCSLAELRPIDVVDSLGRLVDKSLLIVEAGVEAEVTRYRLLETIRQYALEKLVDAGEALEIRKRHAEYFLHLAEESEPKIYGSESVAWFRRLENELDNIRSAIDWSISSSRADLALGILGSLVYFWFSHGLLGSEWNERVQQALSRPEGSEPTKARANALNGMGFMYWADWYPIDNRAGLEEALAIGRKINDPMIIATALRNLGLIEIIQGNHPEAHILLKQSLEILQEIGPSGKMGKANSLIFLGDLALNQGNLLKARSYYEQSISILREPGDVNFLAYAVRRLGHLAWLSSDFQNATLMCKESLEWNQQVHDPRGILACLAAYAASAATNEKYQLAAKLLSAVETHSIATGIRLLYVDRMEYERNLAILHMELDQKTFDKCRTKGRVLSLDQAIALALEEA